jgi:hypothetical protein
VRALAIVVALLGLAGLAHAGEPRADASLQLAVTHHGTFDETDVGAGAQLSYRLTSWLAADAHFNWFPGDLGTPAFSSSRTQGLLGLRVGPHLDRGSVYAAARPGFLRFSEAPAPFPCILIYPPPLGCSLAGGTTAFAMDLAAGYQAVPGGDVVVRLEVGDGLVRYPGPALDADGEAHPGAFWKHSLRFTLSVGLRF